jgi:oxygen-independent coproporphyrinogen-3 oxidase
VARDLIDATATRRALPVQSTLPYSLPETRSLAEWLAISRFHAYAYAYPHKTAYRSLAPSPLRQVWAEEATASLALYLHVPFCEFRCGFCNLFTAHGASGDDGARYVAALERQAKVVRGALGARAVGVASAAIGGGTPTWLAPRELERVLDVLAIFGVQRGAIPVSVETSPATATPERLAILRDAGIARVSIGVQSFVPSTRRAIGRPERAEVAREALLRLLAAGFPRVNLDLVYGAEGQSTAAWEEDVALAIEHAPEEIYLYPLYLRPATGVGRRGASFGDLRPEMLRVAHQRLSAAGYRQRSMRDYVRGDAPALGSPHRCEADAMIGLGPGARSYTTSLHYAHPYSPLAGEVRVAVAGFAEASDHEHAHAHHGVRLDPGEQHRRYVIQMLLQAEGIDLAEHRARFGAELGVLLPELDQLRSLDLARDDGARLALTSEGLACSDAIGPWLYSPAVRAAIAGAERG